jgi:hypothetical protein
MGTSTTACRGGCSGTPTSTTSTRSTRASPEDYSMNLRRSRGPWVGSLLGQVDRKRISSCVCIYLLRSGSS